MTTARDKAPADEGEDAATVFPQEAVTIFRLVD